jgi:hypothetical protein
MSNSYLDEWLHKGLSMHNGNKLPSNMTPANGVTVDAYYVIPYNAIVNQCWDLHRMYTLENQRSVFVSELLERFGTSLQPP